MKWYDKYFMTWISIGLLSVIIGTPIIHKHSPFASYVFLIMNITLIIGVKIDWDNMRRKEQTHETD